MKKIIFTFIVVLAFGSTNTGWAQDCSTIVRPMVLQRGIDTNTYPAEKLEFFCHYSQNSFFITTQVPQGAIVHDINELTDLMSGEKVSRSFVADLNTLSIWRYNFNEFRPKDVKDPIYFRMGQGTGIQYLGVRVHNEAMARTLYPEQYKD
jgi:hypothetical protein